MALTWEAPLTCWGHFSFTNTNTCTALTYWRCTGIGVSEWVSETWPTRHGKTLENPLSPELWSVLSWLWGPEVGSDSWCSRHTSPHATADITSEHMGFQAAISTMLGTQCWVSVVLGWTPHPDTWQAMLSGPYRCMGGFFKFFTTVVTDSLDTGMLLTYIYTLELRSFCFFLSLFDSGLWRQM